MSTLDPGSTEDLLLSRRADYGWAFAVAAVVAIRDAPAAGCPIFDLARLGARTAGSFERRRYAEFKSAAGPGQLAVGDSLFAAAIPRSELRALPSFLDGLRQRAFTSGAFLHQGLLYATLDLEQLVRHGAEILSLNRSTG